MIVYSPGKTAISSSVASIAVNRQVAPCDWRVGHVRACDAENSFCQLMNGRRDSSYKTHQQDTWPILKITRGSTGVHRTLPGASGCPIEGSNTEGWTSPELNLQATWFLSQFLYTPIWSNFMAWSSWAYNTVRFESILLKHNFRRLWLTTVCCYTCPFILNSFSFSIRLSSWNATCSANLIINMILHLLTDRHRIDMRSYKFAYLMEPIMLIKFPVEMTVSVIIAN